MGSYHLHGEYDDEYSQGVTPEENSSSNITGCCYSHNEDNSEHTSQSNDFMKHLSMPPVEEESAENESNTSLPMDTSHPIFESSSIEFSNAISEISINQEKQQEDFYIPRRCSNAYLQPKVKPQPSSLHELEEITLTYDQKGSQMEEPLTCSSKEDTLQAMEELASETKTKFEELDDK